MVGEGQAVVVLAGVGEVDDAPDHLALLVGVCGVVGEIEDGVGLGNGEGENPEQGGDAELAESRLEGLGVGGEGGESGAIAQRQEPDTYGEPRQHGRCAELGCHGQPEKQASQGCISSMTLFGEANDVEEGQAAEEGQHGLGGVEVGQLDMEYGEGSEERGEKTHTLVEEASADEEDDENGACVEEGGEDPTHDSQVVHIGVFDSRYDVGHPPHRPE